MVATALIMLVCQLPTWWFACPVAVVLCREIGVSALREWMAERGSRTSVKVGPLGKVRATWVCMSPHCLEALSNVALPMCTFGVGLQVKTVFQMVSTAVLLEACPGASDFDIALSLGISRSAFFSGGLALMYMSTLLTVVSGVQYFVAAWPTLRQDIA